MSQIKPDGRSFEDGTWRTEGEVKHFYRAPVIRCDDPAHVVQKLIEAEVLKLVRNTTWPRDPKRCQEHGIPGCLACDHHRIPLYRIHLPEKEVSAKDPVVAHLERRLQAEGKSVSSLAARVAELEGALRTLVREGEHLAVIDAFEGSYDLAPAFNLALNRADRALAASEGGEG